MTSVLYSSGLNYQGRNPMGNEIRAIDRRVLEIEKSFSGVKLGMETFIEKQKADAAAALAVAAAAAADAKAAPSAAEFDIKIAELRSQLESAQSILDVMKLRIDKADAASASAVAQASQAKTMATSAAADAASATAAAAAAAAAVPGSSA